MRYRYHRECVMNAKAVVSTVFAIGLATAGLLAPNDASARLRMVTDPDAPRSLPEQGPVNVSWADPASFTEIRYSHNRIESRRGDWVAQLAKHIREYAGRRLPAGERLDVNITDVDRAGDFEPWHGPEFYDTRFVREIYPPRITLTFTRTDANGAVIAQGERKLMDAGFMMDSTVGRESDPLRFEKRMLERWLARELPPMERRSAAR